MNRIIAIFDFDNNRAAVEELVPVFMKATESVYVFTTSDLSSDSVKVVQIPADMNTQPKARNYVNRYFKDMKFDGILHVISTGVQVYRDPAPFMDELEKTMKVLDYGVWFNTVCDGCNYVYSKYNSRMHIDLDIPELNEKTGLSGVIHFTSHSNAQWIAYDFAQVSDDLLRFDEDFTISMFWIIEYLARRRNTKKPDSLYFMNQYMTIGSELGVFGNRQNHPVSSDDQKSMQKEDEIFKSKNINYAQDANIDEVLEKFLKKLSEKAGITV